MLRSLSLITVAVGVLATTVPATSATRSDAPSLAAAKRMMQPGPEDRELASESGTWNVVSTLRLTPDAEPIVTRGIIATRRMIGNYQQEIMKPAPGSDTPDFRRLAYLHYFRVQGCWQYVSMDTRFPVGIMPAKGCEKAHDGKLTLEFDSIPFVGLGDKVEGRSINSNLVIVHDGPDHEYVRQYWTRADGTGRRWLAVQYEYTRRN
jgi:hypothetical protein